MSPKLKEHSRWAGWEDQILSKCKNPKRLQKVILERQRDMDDDDQEKQIIEELIRSRIALIQEPDDAHLFIPVSLLVCWLDGATPHYLSLTKITQYLNRLSIHELQHGRRNKCAGFVWKGREAPKGSKPTPI